jgi:phage tail sheath protein FI
VAVLGAYAYNDSVKYPWYAPAGVSRGTLSDMGITNVTTHLLKSNQDDLYDVDVNPILALTGTGTETIAGGAVTVWGQKTLQIAASALDRVNVRRLLIDIRRKVKRIADSFLFEPNRESTLANFSSAVDPILADIQQKQGLSRYKVIIDTSTTTQADIENNTVRGKIFLQPTRSVEFISLDFVVSNNATDV